MRWNRSGRFPGEAIGRAFRWAAFVLAVFGLLACSGPDDTATATGTSTPTVTAESAEQPSATPSATAPRTPLDLAASGELADLVEELQRSVVSIGTTGGASLFGGAGLGSGIVVDRDGHILTNFHVVEQARGITVKLSDDTLAEAVIVGADPGNDLAVLKAEIDPERLVPAMFGNSDTVRPGDFVFAIGNPFSFEFTVTFGIVSGVNRDSLSTAIGRPIRGVIQTDAAVNPGNSGGPLFNLAGEVIGINTAIENPSGQRVFVGIGLAVPSNTAQRFLPQMLRGEVVRHPQLGIQGVALNEANAADAGVSVTRGVYVVGVAPGGAADLAGVRAASLWDGQGVLGRGGDVIVAFEGEEVETLEALARAVDQRAVGDEVTLTVVSGARRRSN